MAFSSETVGQILASGRHYVSTTVGFIGGIGIMSAAQSKGLTDAVNEIFTGLSMIFHGATSAWAILVVAFPIIGGVMAKFASNSASLPSQAAALKTAAADPNTVVPPEAQKSVIEATAAIAHDRIEASQEAKVVLLDATAALPEVVGDIKVADPALAEATASPQVKPAA